FLLCSVRASAQCHAALKYSHLFFNPVKLGQRLPQLPFVGHFMVPGWLIFHKGDTLSLYGMSNNQTWLSAGKRNCLKSLPELIQVMPVHMLYRPAKALKLFINGVGVADICNSSCNLKFIMIHHSTKIIQLIMCYRKRCFPVRTFAQLTIAHKRKHAVITLIHARSKSHSHAERQAMAQRSGILFYAV